MPKGMSKPAPPKRATYHDLEMHVAALARFCNKWARHTMDCTVVAGEAGCTCGFDVAVRELREKLAKVGYPEPGEVLKGQVYEEGQGGAQCSPR